MISYFGVSLSGIVNIGFVLFALTVVEIILMYYLTLEFFSKEQIVSYANLAFTFAWAILPIYVNFAFIPSEVVILIFFAFIAISAILLLYPFLSYLSKRSDFNSIKSNFNTLESKYNGIVNDYNNINLAIEGKNNKGNVDKTAIIPTIEEIITTIKNANELYESAIRSPEIIIKRIGEKPEIPILHLAKIRYTILGLGGAGVEITKKIINYFKVTGVFDQNDNAVQFILYDTNDTTIKSTMDEYKDSEIERYIHVPVRFSSTDEATILNTAPWLIGESAQIVAGSGIRRGIGSAAYMVYQNQLSDKIQSYIQNIKEKFPGKDADEIIIINSLGGGTGSGTFIKVAMDIKKRLPSVIIYGFGILPSSTEGQLYSANAYATIKELAFLSEKGERILGAQENPIINPFDAYFIVSLESPNQNQKEIISSSISRFLLDLGSGVGFDPNDIKNFFRGTGDKISASTFSTFDYHEILFPASRISWYKNVGKETIEKLSSDYQSLLKKANETKDKAIKLVSDERSFVEQKKEFDNRLIDFEGRMVYKKWKNESKRIRETIQKYYENITIGGKYYADPTYKKINDIINNKEIENSIPNTYEQVETLKNRVQKEYDTLKNPENNSVSKVFPVNNPDDFPIPKLMDPTTTLTSVMKDRKGELDEAFNRLTRRIGEVGLTMANINFGEIKVPINVSGDELDFIRQYLPQLAPENAGYVYTIPIGGAMLATVTHSLNITQLPGDSELKSSVNTLSNSDPLIKRAELNSKRFSVATYWNLSDIYIGKPRDDKEPILKDLKFLEEGYLKEVQQNKQRMFVHHTLFYDSPSTFSNITQIPTATNLIESRNIITDFWINYNPFLSSVKYWGIMNLAMVYSTINQVIKNINEFSDLLIKVLDNINSGAIVDYASLENSKRTLEFSINNMKQRFKLFIDLKKYSLERVEIRDALEYVNQHLDLMISKINEFNEIRYKEFQEQIKSISDNIAKSQKLSSKRALEKVVDLLNDIKTKIEGLNNTIGEQILH